MCHRRTDWSWMASKASEPEEELEKREEAASEDDDTEREDDLEEDPIPADD